MVDTLLEQYLRQKLGNFSCPSDFRDWPLLTKWLLPAPQYQPRQSFDVLTGDQLSIKAPVSVIMVVLNNRSHGHFNDTFQTLARQVIRSNFEGSDCRVRFPKLFNTLLCEETDLLAQSLKYNFHALVSIMVMSNEVKYQEIIACRAVRNILKDWALIWADLSQLFLPYDRKRNLVVVGRLLPFFKTHDRILCAVLRVYRYEDMDGDIVTHFGPQLKIDRDDPELLELLPKLKSLAEFLGIGKKQVEEQESTADTTLGATRGATLELNESRCLCRDGGRALSRW